MLDNYGGPERDRKHKSTVSLIQHSLLLNLSRSGIREDHTASYFSHENVEATRLRDKLAADSLEMLIQWLKDGGNVGILGAILG